MKSFVHCLFFPAILAGMFCASGCDGPVGVVTASGSSAQSTEFQIRQLAFLRDNSGSLGATDVLGPVWWEEFTEFGRGIPAFGFSEAAIWCRIDLRSRSASSVVAELASSRLDHVTWFEVRDGKILREVSNGWRDGKHGMPAPTVYPALQVDLSPDERCIVLVRVRSECALSLPLSVVSEGDFARVVVRRGYFAHVQVGASLSVVAMCLLLGLAFRNSQFTLLGLCCGAGFVYGVLYDPVLSLQSFSVSPSAARIGSSLAATITSLVMIFFCGVYAELQSLRTFDRRLLFTAILLTAGLLLLHLFIPFGILNRFHGLFLSLIECCGIWIISSPWRRKREAADFYVLIAVLLVHLPALVFILQLHQATPMLFPPQSLRFVALPTVASGLTCLLIRRRQHAQQLRISIAQAQAGESEARLAALRFQLNPHMLLNCLTAISELSRTAPERIPVLIEHLATILQSRLKPTPGQLWTLAEELHLARALVEVQHVRYGNSPSLQETVQADAETCLIPEMLLQPLVENALKYGRSDLGPPRITLDATVVGNRLTVTIGNTGIMGETEKIASGFGIGFANIRQRLDLLYAEAAEFHVVQSSEQFKVVLVVPALLQR